MKINLSKKTLAILANFAKLNQSFEIKKGVTQRTVTVDKTTVAEAELEYFPVDCAFYNLQKLLNAVDFLGDDATWDFKENQVSISDKKNTLTYRYANVEDNTIVVTPYKLGYKFPIAFPKDAEIKFDLYEDALHTLIKTNSILGNSHLVFVGDSERVVAKSTNMANPGANTFIVDLGAKTNHTFEMTLNFANLLILNGSYEVSLSSNSNSKFSHMDHKLDYYLGCNIRYSNFSK